MNQANIDKSCNRDIVSVKKKTNTLCLVFTNPAWECF